VLNFMFLFSIFEYLLKKMYDGLLENVRWVCVSDRRCAGADIHLLQSMPLRYAGWISSYWL